MSFNLRPSRGSIGGGHDMSRYMFHGGYVSSGNRCADAYAFQNNPKSVALLSVYAVFLFLYLIFLVVALVVPCRLRKRGRGIAGGVVSPSWWLFVLAIVLQIIAFIIRLIELVFKECYMWYKDLYTLPIAVLWLAFTASLVMLGFIAFPLVRTAHAAYNTKPKLVSTCARGIFYALVIIFTLIPVCMFTWLLCQLGKVTSIGDLRLKAPKVFRVERSSRKLFITMYAFATALAVSIGLAIISWRVKGGALKAWSIILTVMLILLPLQYFIEELYFLDYPRDRTLGTIIALFTVGEVFAFAVFVASMCTYVTAARMAIQSRLVVEDAPPATSHTTSAPSVTKPEPEQELASSFDA